MNLKAELRQIALDRFADFCIELSQMIDDGLISNTAAKQVFRVMYSEPLQILHRCGYLDD